MNSFNTSGQVNFPSSDNQSFGQNNESFNKNNPPSNSRNQSVNSDKLRFNPNNQLLNRNKDHFPSCFQSSNSNDQQVDSNSQQLIPNNPEFNLNPLSCNPNNQAPLGLPVHPHNKQFNRTNQQFSPGNNQQFSPNNQQFTPNNQQFNPNTQQFNQNNQKLSSHNNEFNPNIQQFTPNNQQFDPNIQQFNPTSPQFNPNIQQFNPNSQPFNPNNQQFNPNNQQFNPNNQQFNPNNQQFNPNNKQFIMNNQQIKPNANNQQFNSNNQQFLSSSTSINQFNQTNRQFNPDYQQVNPSNEQLNPVKQQFNPVNWQSNLNPNNKVYNQRIEPHQETNAPINCGSTPTFNHNNQVQEPNRFKLMPNQQELNRSKPISNQQDQLCAPKDQCSTNSSQSVCVPFFPNAKRTFLRKHIKEFQSSEIRQSSNLSESDDIGHNYDNITTWLQKWEESVLAKRKSRKNDEIKLCDLKDSIHTWSANLLEMADISDQLKNDELSLEKESYYHRRVEQLKNELEKISQLFESKVRNPHLKELIEARRHKRLQERKNKNKKREWRKKKKEEWNAKEQAIDKWRNNLIREETEKIEKEKLGKEVDGVLLEVRTKISDVKQRQKLLNHLVKLRAARAKKGEHHGYKTTPNIDLQFQKVVDELNSIAQTQLQQYNSEEHTLKVMLEHSKKSKQPNKSTTIVKVDKNEQLKTKAWEGKLRKILFGTSEEKTIEKKRSSWEKYIVENGNEDSVLPSGWVIPPLEPTDSWKKFQCTYNSYLL